MEYKVSLASIIDNLKLKIIYLPEDAGPTGKERMVTSVEVNRPGLILAGFYDHFEDSRIQIFGNVEMSFLEDMNSEKRLHILDVLCARGVPAIVVTRDKEPFAEMLTSAKKYGIPLLISKSSTSRFMSALISFLNVEMAPRVTRHGVLVEVYGEGILILGDSGIGKSETAMELLKRGHRLVADDAVEIKSVSDITLVGSSPDLIRYLIELRGIGIVDVRQIFGMGAVKETSKIDLVVQLEKWNEQKQYDRLGIDDQFYELLDHKIPSVTIPIMPGRNLAVIVEVAAMNNRQKRSGYNAAVEFNKRLLQQLGSEGES